MLALLRGLPGTERLYLSTSGDVWSLAKACAYEAGGGAAPRASAGRSTDGVQIPRARAVGQSWITTPFTLAWSILFCVWHLGLAPLWRHARRGDRLPFADVLLMNGPATCVPIGLVIRALRVAGIPTPRIVYIESFARVNSLSLTGKVMKHLADRFAVQWRTADGDAAYYGILV
ncbi:N-acetylglucosaminyldiphosphodolichol N-acetylglucosaminyltransferase [Malassezia sp. CBS 17886]|nr:N-acetylglucosaminyldiphosphodolichol N-acetylglucosaminyltransferase [Malassezia sp. CBS 17886]